MNTETQKVIKTVDEILAEAFAAAKEAADKMIAENPTTWYPCGFAWVRIKPARGKFVVALKEAGKGRTDDYKPGFVVYNPSGNATQWMDAKAAGARAFAAVLKKHGVNCSPEVRID